MTLHPSLRAERGATLIVGMIMLALITVMVTSAFMLSTSNLKSVGNMQFRNEAISAANLAIERVTDTPFTVNPVTDNINVDLNKDGVTDYTVVVAPPVCVRAKRAETEVASSVTLGPVMSTVTDWNTVWEITATVTDPASGASIIAKSGIRVLRSDIQKTAECT